MTIQQSYAFCETVARTQAKNFYYSFLLLKPPQRRAMCAVYAFMRNCDDLSDGAGIADRQTALARWRGDLQSALSGALPSHAVWPAFADTVERYRIPPQYFFQMIDGVSSDLEPRVIATFEDLYRYCYLVASVVGLTIVHIFGFDSPAALKLAEECGVAFQLTNIIRDVREDAEAGRTYIPSEDLERFGVEPSELRGAEVSDRLRALLRFEGQRAREYYSRAAPLPQHVNPESRAALRALIGIYSRLLDRIAASDYEVLRRRVSLPAWEKVWVLARSRFAI